MNPENSKSEELLSESIKTLFLLLDITEIKTETQHADEFFTFHPTIWCQKMHMIEH